MTASDVEHPPAPRRDDRLAKRPRPALHAVGGGGRHVVLAAPSRSDAGNRAVVDALLELTGGPVDLVLGDGRDGRPPQLVPSRAALYALPALLSGTKHERRTAVVLVERLFAAADHCTVVAPDLISDRDDVHAFVRCLAIARTAALAEVDARVIGFTWSLGGGSTGVLAVEAAARAGVQLHARDDLSLIRAMNEGLPNVHAAADLAFAGTDLDPGVLDEVAARDRPIAVVAVRAAVTPGFDPAAEYVAIAEHLQRRGAHVVLLPSAPTGYDLLLLGRVARAIASGGATVLRRPLAAAELRALTGAARVTVTDCARTAVVALSAGSSVLGLATHRELEALLRSTGLQRCAVLPRAGFSGAAVRVADEILDDEATVRREVRRALPELVALAKGSIAGLPAITGGARMRG